MLGRTVISSHGKPQHSLNLPIKPNDPGASAKFIMLALDLKHKKLFVVITFPSCSLEGSDFFLLKSPTHSLFELLAANLLPRLLLFRSLQFGLEARLHTNPYCCVKVDVGSIATNFWSSIGFG